MKISAQEEYGIRCLLQLGCCGPERIMTIPEIAQAEGISNEYVAKLLRVLRRGGLVRSVRGKSGGYMLARPAGQISVREALTVLGGKLWDPAFCKQHPGRRRVCRRSPACSVRWVWRGLQQLIDGVLSSITLEDLLRGAKEEAAASARVLVPLGRNSSKDASTRPT